MLKRKQRKTSFLYSPFLTFSPSLLLCLGNRDVRKNIVTCFRFFLTRLAFNRFLLEKMTERRTNDLCLLNNRCFCVNNLQMLRLVKKVCSSKKNAPKISNKSSYQKQQKSLFCCRKCHKMSNKSFRKKSSFSHYVRFATRINASPWVWGKKERKKKGKKERE